VYGLRDDEWRDLVLSVNVHRKNRRLSPVQVARHMTRALQEIDAERLARALGFGDTTTLTKILRLGELPADLASLVDWGTRRGSVSMSAAAEILRLSSPTAIEHAMRAAVEHNLTREEARQVVQVQKRSGGSIQECVESVLRTRPRVERSELIIGSFVSEVAKARIASLGNEAATRILRRILAREYPNVTCQAVRVNGDRFSLLLSLEDSAKLRSGLRSRSVEGEVTRLVEALKET